jgi:hypothetical protein
VLGRNLIKERDGLENEDLRKSRKRENKYKYIYTHKNARVPCDDKCDTFET